MHELENDSSLSEARTYIAQMLSSIRKDRDQKNQCKAKQQKSVFTYLYLHNIHEPTFSENKLTIIEIVPYFSPLKRNL